MAAAASSSSGAVAASASSAPSGAARTRRGRVSIDYDKVKAQSDERSYHINQPHIMSGGAFGQGPVALLVAIEYHLLQAQLDKQHKESKQKTSAEIDAYMKLILERREKPALQPLMLNLNPDIMSDSDEEEEDKKPIPPKHAYPTNKPK